MNRPQNLVPTRSGIQEPISELNPTQNPNSHGGCAPHPPAGPLGDGQANSPNDDAAIGQQLAHLNRPLTHSAQRRSILSGYPSLQPLVSLLTLNMWVGSASSSLCCCFTCDMLCSLSLCMHRSKQQVSIPVQQNSHQDGFGE